MIGSDGFLRSGELLYGLVVGVDIEGFSKLGVLEQAAAQVLLAKVLEEAASAAGLDREDWYRQPRGDGELAVLPGHVDVAWVMARFTHHLAHALDRLPADARPHANLRLRVSMHHGPLTAGKFGPVGTAPILACRLLDAHQTKAALAADPCCRLVLVISRQLFQDVVATRFHGLRPERFRPIRALIKGTVYIGHVCLGSPMGELADPVGA